MDESKDMVLRIIPPTETFFLVPSSGGFSLAFTANDGVSPPSNPQTFAAKSIGGADANRIVAVGVIYRCSNAFTDAVTALTIGGVSATKVIGSEASLNRVSGDLINSVIWYAAIPAGTTADIVVTWDFTPLRTGIVVYRVVTTTTAPTNSGGEIKSGTDVDNAATVPASGAGFAIGGCREDSGGGTTSWTNAIEDADTETPDVTMNYSGAHFTTSNTITATFTNANTVGNAISWASWQP